MAELLARRRRRHLEVHVDIPTRELYFLVFIQNSASDQRYLDRTLIPPFYTEFRSASAGHSGMACEAIFANFKFINVFKQCSDIFSRNRVQKSKPGNVSNHISSIPRITGKN